MEYEAECNCSEQGSGSIMAYEMNLLSLLNLPLIWKENRVRQFEKELRLKIRNLVSMIKMETNAKVVVRLSIKGHDMAQPQGEN